MKKIFALIAFAAFFGALSAPTFANDLNERVVITINDEKPKKAETKSDAKKGCKSECASAEKKTCNNKEKK